VYCINAARYLFQDEPIAAFAMAANNGEERFREVNEMTSAILRFPRERLAAFTLSFGAGKVSSYRIVGTTGDLRLEPAYSWHGQLKHYLTRNGETRERTFEPHSQLAAEFTYFSDCILQDREPEPSGQEGLIDVRIVRALYRSIEQGKPVDIPPLDKRQRPTAQQTIQHPPNPDRPDPIHATSPGDS
jgi:glucose-fructose oxidoreductase